MGSFSLSHWIVIGVIAFFIYKLIASNSGGGSGQIICKSCGHVGGGKTTTRGSIGIEIVLWLLLIVPGIIYSVWRHASRYSACPECGSKELIPVDSPFGKKLVAERNATEK